MRVFMDTVALLLLAAGLISCSNGARDAIGAWLEDRGLEPGPLLCPVNKAGKVDLPRT